MIGGRGASDVRCAAWVAGRPDRSRSCGAPPADEAAHGTRQAGTPAARWGDVLDGCEGHDEGKKQEAEDALRPETIPEVVRGGRDRHVVAAAIPDDDRAALAHERHAAAVVDVELDAGRDVDAGFGLGGDDVRRKQLVLRRVDDRRDEPARAAEGTVLRAAEDV